MQLDPSSALTSTAEGTADGVLKSITETSKLLIEPTKHPSHVSVPSAVRRQPLAAKRMLTSPMAARFTPRRRPPQVSPGRRISRADNEELGKLPVRWSRVAPLPPSRDSSVFEPCGAANGHPPRASPSSMTGTAAARARSSPSRSRSG